MPPLRLSGSIAGMVFLVGCAATPPTASDGPRPTAATSTGSYAADSSPATTSSASPSLAPKLLAAGALACDVTGQVEGFPLQLYGRFDVNNTDDHILVAQEGPGEPFVYEERTIGSSVWERTNGEPWGPSSGDADTVPRLRRSIDRADGWTDLGAQPSAGPSLRRLRAAGAPASATDFGLESADGDNSLSLEIDTSGDGSPVVMHIAGATLNAELTCVHRAVPRPATPPDFRDVKLSHGVSLAVPVNWELDRSDPKELTVTGPDSDWITVQGAQAKGLSLDEWTKDGVDYFTSNWQATPGAASLVTVADEQAVLATWHLPIDGVQALFLDVSTVRNGWGYDIEFFSQAGREPAERAVFEQILTTVTFGKP